MGGAINGSMPDVTEDILRRYAWAAAHRPMNRGDYATDGRSSCPGHPAASQRSLQWDPSAFQKVCDIALVLELWIVKE